MRTVALVFTERFCGFFVNQGKKPFCGGEESLPADKYDSTSDCLVVGRIILNAVSLWCSETVTVI